MKVDIIKFGELNNEDVLCYRIKNESMEIEILSYGGIIKSLKTPDKNGVFENIVLGYETFEEYIENKYYYGSIIGRTAGRISNGVLKIDDKEYKLAKNNGKHNLHGGIYELDKKNWKSEIKVADHDKFVLKLNYTSPHLEEGYPGEVKFEVEYIIEENSLKIEYLGIPDRKTYLNLTNHTYFNLSGNQTTEIKKNKIYLNTNSYIKVNNETIPKEIEKEVLLIESKKLIEIDEILKSEHEQIKIVGGGLDHPFILSQDNDVKCILCDQKSGRSLEIWTDQPVVVIYSGNYLENKHTGICFETQDYPDVGNFEQNQMKEYSENAFYIQKTNYIFKNYLF